MKTLPDSRWIFCWLLVCMTGIVFAGETVKDSDIATIEIGNPSEFDRPDTLIGLSLNQLGVDDGPLQVWSDGGSVPTQLVDDNGDGRPDRMVFLTSLEAGALQSYVVNRKSVKMSVKPRVQAEISTREGGAWDGSKYLGGVFKNADHVSNPPQYTDHSEWIRYEGPGIESDRVGYRVYLDWRNGFDIFGKKTRALVLQDVGQDGYDSYHEMADWGADILKVGQSLGAGGYGYWDGEKVVLVSDVQQRSVTIGSNGPVHASFRIDYEGWNTGSATVNLSATLSMQPGSPMVNVDLETSESLDRMAIGFVAHPGTELLMGDLDITGEAWSYMASFGTQSLFDDALGMVVMFRKKDLLEQVRDENSYVLVMRPRGTRLSYAFGALWAGEPGGVQTREELEDWLTREVEIRTLPPRIRLQTKRSAKAAVMEPLELARAIGQSEMERRGDSLSFGGWDSVTRAPAKWTYTTGLLMEAMDALSAATGEPAFAELAQRTMDSYLLPDGGIHTYKPESFNIDHINSGKMLQRLLAQHGDDRYRNAIDTLASQLEQHPRTSEGAFWHKQRYPHQLWLDGVYMGMPFLAGVGVMEDDVHKIEEAAQEFVIARKHLRDAGTGLYYHAWDEAREQGWADPDTGQSRYFWGRGLGWFAMGLVDILDVIPEENETLRDPLLEMVPELAAALLRFQDETGVWFQVLDRPEAPGNYREASGTAMFTYFLAKALNRGYLPEEYRAAALKAYRGMVREFVAINGDGSFSVTNICEVAGLGYGRDGSYRYYMSERVVENDPKGLAPTLLAILQISEFD